MDLLTLRFLASDEGENSLRAVQGIEGPLISRIEAAQRLLGRERGRAAVTLLMLREKARTRFPDADRMIFTTPLLVQATSARLARWRASRMPAGLTVTDLTAGAGGDLLALAGRGPVLAVDRDSVALFVSRTNVERLAPSSHVAFVQADASDFRPRAGAVFVDPSRRDADRRTVDPERGSPRLSAFLDMARKTLPLLVVKLAPAVKKAALPAGAEIEFVSDGGELKECVLWYGEGHPPGFRASIPRSRFTLFGDLAETSVSPKVGTLGSLLFDPDPALVRSGLLASLARKLGLAFIDPSIAALTGGEDPGHPALEAFAVEAVFGIELSAVKAYLREKGVGRVTIRRRGFPVSVAEVEKQLRLAGEAERVLHLVRSRERRQIVITRALARRETPEPRGAPRVGDAAGDG